MVVYIKVTIRNRPINRNAKKYTLVLLDVAQADDGKPLITEAYNTYFLLFIDSVTGKRG